MNEYILAVSHKYIDLNQFEKFTSSVVIILFLLQERSFFILSLFQNTRTMKLRSCMNLRILSHQMLSTLKDFQNINSMMTCQALYNNITSIMLQNQSQIMILTQTELIE